MAADGVTHILEIGPGRCSQVSARRIANKEIEVIPVGMLDGNIEAAAKLFV